jgi:excisionase family DNA binding protein
MSNNEIDARLRDIETALLGHTSPWLNIREASDYTRVSTTTLRRWIVGGLLPGHRPHSDGKLLLHKREIDALLLFGKVRLTRPQREALKNLQ